MVVAVGDASHGRGEPARRLPLMLRDGVLTGRTIALAGADPVLAAALQAAGADTVHVGSPSLSEGRTALGAPSTLVADARPAFEAAGGGYDGVRAGVDGAFAVVRDVAVAHWIRGEEDAPAGHAPPAASGDSVVGVAPASAPGGQAILVAPAPGAGRHSGAARSGLENLVRTLSTEWARHQITTVAVLPGDATTEAALADLVAWLCSPAGAYLSGTALTLDRQL